VIESSQPTFPVEIARRKQWLLIGIVKPAEPYSPYAYYRETVLAVVILSVRLSHACFLTKPSNALPSADILIPHERRRAVSLP